MSRRPSSAAREKPAAPPARVANAGPAGGGSPPAPGETNPAGKPQADLSAQQAQWAQQNGLHDKELGPGASAQGAVFFPHITDQEYVLRIPVGNYLFEFPFGNEATANPNGNHPTPNPKK